VGEGKTAEIDGGYFRGYVKPANLRENRRDRRLREHQSGKRQCLVVIRERDGVHFPAPIARKAKRSISFAERLLRVQKFTLTNPARGTHCMAASS
jgi:hypothetical protein